MTSELCLGWRAGGFGWPARCCHDRVTHGIMSPSPSTHPVLAAEHRPRAAHQPCLKGLNAATDGFTETGRVRYAPSGSLPERRSGDATLLCCWRVLVDWSWGWLSAGDRVQRMAIDNGGGT